MRTRQTVKPVLWLFVLLIVGTVESLRGALRIVALLRFKGLAALAVLIAAWRSSDLLAAQLSLDTVRPLGYGIGSWAACAGAALVVACGLRSRLRRRLWAQLAARLRLARE